MALTIRSLASRWQRADGLIRLVWGSLGFFLLLSISQILCGLFAPKVIYLHHYLTFLPGLYGLTSQPWGMLTYMWVYTDPLQLLNILLLYLLLPSLRQVVGSRQSVGIFVGGGMLGALVYGLVYQLMLFFPPSLWVLDGLPLLGSSASLSALIMALGLLHPYRSLHLLGLIRVRVMHLIIILILLDLIGLFFSNAGGHMAHLGGACFGYAYAYWRKRGFDFIDWAVAYLSCRSNPTGRGLRASEKEELKHLLTKLRQSGYSSLSPQEQKRLFILQRLSQPKQDN